MHSAIDRVVHTQQCDVLLIYNPFFSAHDQLFDTTVCSTHQEKVEFLVSNPPLPLFSPRTSHHLTGP